MDVPKAVDAAVSAYTLTCMARHARRPTPADVATFRGYVERALQRVDSSPPPPPSAAPDDDARDSTEPTRPTRPHPRPR